MNIPTYNDLYQSVISDLKYKFGINSLVGKVVFNIIAAVQAAKLKLIYLLAADIYKNIFVDTADDDTIKRYGLVKLERLPYDATAGEYKMQVTAQIGAEIKANTTWSSVKNGKLFVLDNDITITSNPQEIDIRALEPGTEGRLEINDELQVTSPIVNVDSYAYITSVTVTPSNAEDIEDYRTKVIQSYQYEPQGGARTDYRLWSSDAQGVREVYPYVVDGEPGNIRIYVEAYPDDSVDGNGTPPQSMLDDVKDVIEFDPDTSKPLYERGRRPMGTFNIYVQSITPLSVDIVIHDLTDTSFLNQIKDSLKTFIYDIRPFIGGADNPIDIQKGLLYKSDIINVVRQVIGLNNTFSDLDMSVDGTNYDIYEFLDGDIPFINNVSVI